MLDKSCRRPSRIGSKKAGIWLRAARYLLPGFGRCSTTTARISRELRASWRR
jgi:hypothetical protein